MQKREFLRELENILEGESKENEVREIVQDYGRMFDEGISEGAGEEEVSARLGSPARIGRAILDETGERQKRPDGGEETYGPKKGNGYGDHTGARQYTGFQEKVNSAAKAVKDCVTDSAARGAEDGELASMGRRLGAYLLDTMIILGAIFILGFFFVSVISFGGNHGSFSDIGYYAGEHAAYGLRSLVLGGLKNLYYGSFPAVFSGVFLSFLLIGGLFASTLFLWITDGYTPGKWLLGIRVVKVRGGKIRFIDAFFREFLIKGIADSILKGVLNLGSFIWGCVTADHKTVQDLAAGTAVIRAERSNAKRNGEDGNNEKERIY